MRIATSAAALLTVLALAACSSTSNGDPTTGPSSPGSTPHSTSTTTGATSFPSTTSQPPTSGGLTQAQAQAALLTAAEVGGGFTKTRTDDTDSPLPCTPNAPSLSQQFPPRVKAQIDFSGLNGKAFLGEEIEGYADGAHVAQAIAAGERGLSCGTTTVSGTAVKIAGPIDLSDELDTHVDKAEAWTISSSVVNGSLIIAQLGRHLVVFTLDAAPSASTATLPDGQKIVNDGIAKVSAALN